MANSEDPLRRCRVSYSQLEILCEFLNSHRNIAHGFNKSAQDRDYSRKMWQEVALMLNSIGEGATKNWKGWSTYWVDYKAKLKRKATKIRNAKRETGDEPSTEPPLSDVEERFLQIMAIDIGASTPAIDIGASTPAIDIGAGRPGVRSCRRRVLTPEAVRQQLLENSQQRVKIERVLARYRVRVSYSQLEALYEFLNSHRNIAHGFNKSAQDRDYSRKMWQEVALILNSIGEGATKNWKGWSKYWVDYKAKLKGKATKIRNAKRETGGGPSTEPPLSDLEERFLQIMAIDIGAGTPAIDIGANSPAIDIGANSPAIDIGANSPAIDIGANSPDVRSCRRHVLTPEAVRQQLLENSQQRVNIERANSQLLGRLVNVLERMEETLRRIEAK